MSAALLSAALLYLGSRPAEAASETAMPCQAATTPALAALPRLHVVVTGAERVKGNVTFTLYGADPAAFLAHKGSIALTRVTLTTTQAEACFAVSAAGTYAVAVYHDENNNHHFDRTMIGLPAEGYGFSNNVTPLLGLPSFGTVRFMVQPGDNRIAPIRLRY